MNMFLFKILTFSMLKITQKCLVSNQKVFFFVDLVGLVNTKIEYKKFEICSTFKE